ncbi:MAG: hypothetical protein ACHP9T_08270 [Caulobacterales bacterium]|jgi:hypothetical protein
MTHTPVPRKPAPSPWAVGLFVLSSGFALAAIALVSTGYSPL